MLKSKHYSMTELATMLAYKTDLKPATKKSYESVYNRLVESGDFSYSLHETAQDKIIKIINGISNKPSTRLNMLNVAIVMKQAHDRSVVLLLEQREKYVLEQKREREQSNKELTIELPTLAELKEYLHTLFLEQKWLEFVVNFLLINLNVRNSDLFLNIADNGRNLPTDNNYLVIRSKDIQYIRNVYKTVETYNTKKNSITDKQFIHAVKQLGIRPLIVDKSGEKIPLASIGVYVKRLSYQQRGEIQIFKAVLNNGTINKLKKATKARGTNLETAIEHYHVSGEGDV